MIKFLKSILKILKKAIKKEHMRGGIAVYFKKLLISGFLGFLFSQPSVNVNPSSLISNLLTGEAEIQSLIISNTGSNELSFSVNVVTSETRWSFPEINYQGAPTVPMIQNMQNLWVDLKESSSVSFIQNEQSSISRSSRNWQLLASDPQDNDSPYDTKYVYYELTDTSLNFKYEYYDPWEDPLGNTAAILYLNIDSSPETGITDDNLVGIDMLIYSVGDNELDGVYIYLEENYYGGGFVRADNLLWSNREPNTNKFSFGFSNEFFEGLVLMPIASISGSLNYQPDLVPNEGMLDLSFGPNWLSVVPDEGQVLSEEFLELDVAFDATDLYGGVYQATIEILSNDPETQQLDIPVVLTVTGAPDILVSDEIVDFGTLYTNYGGSKEIIISNDGTDVLEISSITIDNTSYILSFSEAVVPYNDEVILIIDFMPLENGEHNGHLTIISNDVDEPQIVVPVLGSSIAPPIISVNPSSLSSNLLTGETETQFLTISNNGESDLSISVSTINVNSRSSMLIPDPGVATNRLKTEDLKNLWNIDNTFSSESALTRHLSRNNSRPMRNWQLLANDPQDYGSPYDTENIYYEVTDTTLNFKYEYYESWENFYGNTIAVLMFNIDNDLQTGLVIDDYGMIEGIDMVVYSTGLTDYYGIDGVYVFDSAYDDLIQIDNLSWENRENNTNEFSFGIPFEYFRGLTSITVASQSGSLNEDGPDIVPNEGMAELLFGLPWLSIQQEEETISEGSVFDLGVVFDATGLFGGDYEAIINIRSNDPVYPVMEIPVYLNVTGVPIVDFPTEVDFGQVFVGYPDTLEYTIANIGTDLLLVENISFQDTWLSSELGNLSIAPLEHISLNLVAQINNPDTFVTNMSFTTNDLQNTVVEDVIVSAMSVYPPEMNISQSEFVFTHTSETSETNEFVITNTGGSSLQWQIEFESLSGSLDEWFFFEKIDFSDFASEENQDRITDNVWIARENSGPFFNYYLENVPEYGCDSQTPSGTLWSPYSKENSNNNSYVPFIQMTGCCPPCIVGDTVSVWLLQDDLKLNVVFSSWTSGGQGGGFSYHREQVIPQWIEVLPTEGVVDVDGSQEIFISVNSFGLQQGEHSTVLLFNSNDPEFPSMPIPVDLVYVLGTQDQQTPKAYALYPTYPNPFNPSTIIQFDVPKNLTQNVGLYVFDIRGKLVETILDKELSSGSYSIRWDAKSKSSGVYFLRMVTDNYIKNRKMILMK